MPKNYPGHRDMRSRYQTPQRKYRVSLAWIAIPSLLCLGTIAWIWIKMKEQNGSMGKGAAIQGANQGRRAPPDKPAETYPTTDSSITSRNSHYFAMSERTAFVEAFADRADKKEYLDYSQPSKILFMPISDVATILAWENRTEIELLGEWKSPFHGKEDSPVGLQEHWFLVRHKNNPAVQGWISEHATWFGPIACKNCQQETSIRASGWNGLPHPIHGELRCQRCGQRLPTVGQPKIVAAKPAFVK